jgi:hypothetical protein
LSQSIFFVLDALFSKSFFIIKKQKRGIRKWRLERKGIDRRHPGSWFEGRKGEGRKVPEGVEGCGNRA